jgi:hypothetical protein
MCGRGEVPSNKEDFQDLEAGNGSHVKKDSLFLIFPSSEWYASFLKTAQYVSCVCLAFTLFAPEFFQSWAYLAEQILYYSLVALPVAILHGPLFVGFLASLPQCVRKSSFHRFYKLIALEGLLIVCIFGTIPVAILLTIWGEDLWLANAIVVPTSTLSVVFYYFSLSSFRQYKTDILEARTKVNAQDDPHIDHDSEWALGIQDHGDKEQQGNAMAVFLRLAIRFYASSAVAWISLILYTACLPIQGLTIGYITKAFAEATPDSSFWELFRPGKILILFVRHHLL